MKRKPLTLPENRFDSNLTALIVELERVRSKYDYGTTPPTIFMEVKSLFQLMTSMISARIEGNHTTVVDALEAINDNSDSGTELPDSVHEIDNIQKGMDFIDRHIFSSRIDKQFICELHRIVVDNLHREGDERPGGYRKQNVTISKSKHRPPEHTDVDDYMDELIEFINSKNPAQYDLLKDAVAHHRFVWIHPFSNGNGRVARLLTYAMMVRQGFIDTSGLRILNPTAVFGSNREEYYDALARADSLKDEDILHWAEYMLGGVRIDLEKVEKLQDAEYVRSKIIIPALRSAHEKGRITNLEYQMLTIAAQKDYVVAKDFDDAFGKKVSHVVRAQAIRKLKDARLLRPQGPSVRRYSIQLVPNSITTHIMRQLDENGLLPDALKD